MPLDPDAEILLEMVRAANRPAFETVGAAEARLLFNAGRKVLAPDPMPVAETRGLATPGPGGPIPARLYRGAAIGTLPVLVFFHGGGWVVGDIESHDTVCRHLANRAGCAVVSVDYRLAPEPKFPAARLAAAGIAVTHRQFPGQVHGFAMNGKIIRAAETALDEAAAALKQAWN